MKKSVKFSPEVRERAVRMAAESRADHPSLWSDVESTAARIGGTPQLVAVSVHLNELDSRLLHTNQIDMLLVKF